MRHGNLAVFGKPIRKLDHSGNKKTSPRGDGSQALFRNLSDPFLQVRPRLAYVWLYND